MASNKADSYDRHGNENENTPGPRSSFKGSSHRQKKGKDLEPDSKKQDALPETPLRPTSPVIALLENAGVPNLTGRAATHRLVFEGTYSNVYQGVFQNKPVAIKVIRTLKEAQNMERKLRREIEIWWRLQHPNILPCLGFVEGLGDYGGIVSPWCQNGDAWAYLQTDPDSWLRVKIYRGVAKGLRYLHEHKPTIIHGDVKPVNVLIDDNLNARLCDFGLVSLVNQDGALTGMTTTTAHHGTVRYLAFELVKYEKRPSTASDIYALGCVGFGCLYTEVPYANIRNDQFLAHHKVYREIEQGKPPATRPDDLNVGMKKFWDHLDACWSIEPQMRPTAARIVQFLDENDREIAESHAHTKGSLPYRLSNDYEPTQVKDGSYDLTIAQHSAPSLLVEARPSNHAHSSTTLVLESKPARDTSDQHRSSDFGAMLLGLVRRLSKVQPNVPQMDESWKEIQQKLESGRIQFIEAMELFADALTAIRKDAREEHTNWFLLSLKAEELVIDRPMDVPTPSMKTMNMSEFPVMTRFQCRRVEWIHSCRRYPEATMVKIFKSLTNAQLRSLPPLWRFVATDEEVDDFLAGIDAQDRGIMKGLMSAERQNNHHVDALKAFDDLLINQDGLTDAVLELVFEDLGLPKSPFHINPYTNEHKRIISSMRHPFLQLVACAVTGVKWEDAWSQKLDNYIHKSQCFAGWERVTRYCFKEHPSHNPSTIWNLRTRLWPYFEKDRIRRILMDALTDYAPAGFTLSSLESGFEMANVGIKYGGDHLLAMIHLSMIRTGEYSTHYRFTDTLDGDSLWSIWSRPEIFTISESSEAYLSKLCHTIEEDQTRLIRLLIELFRTERWRLTVGHVRKITAIAMKHLVVKDMRSPRDCRKQLANVVIKLRSSLLLRSPDFPDRAARERFTLECEKLIDGLSPATSK